MSSQHVPSSLSSAAQPAASLRASHRRLLDQKHLFPFGRRSQIPGSPEPSGLFLHPAHSSRRRSVDRKRPFPLFPGRSQLPGSLEFFGPFLHPAHSSRRAPSLLRAASRPSLRAWPRSPRALLQSRAFFPRRACSLMVTAVRLAVAPLRRQPAPANSLLVN